VTADGKPIAKAKTPAVAEDRADRLNEDDHRKEQESWSQLVVAATHSAQRPQQYHACWGDAPEVDPTCPVQPW
jgi:hypothetical protein